MKARAPAVIVICLLATIFVWGLLQIFDMRFSRGDIYPPYSSLRTDPLGTRIFYESLEHLSNMDVVRNQSSYKQFAVAENVAFFYVGARGLSLTDKELTDLEKFINRGGRFVFTFYPQGNKSWLVENAKPTPSASPVSNKKKKEDDAESKKIFLLTDVQQRWEFHLAAENKFEVTDATTAVPGIDRAIPWHSSLSFQTLGAAWHPVYSIGERPVVIERAMGNGTIVMASDSYFLSNEAMRRDRRASFLAWLVGDKRRVMFDEVHHGVREVAGVSTLIRRYRLGGFVAAALLIAILLCWKNMVHLVPAAANRPEGDEFVSGKESFAGLTSLFRRNIAPSEVAEVCYSEWNKSLPRAARSVQLTADRVRAAMEEFRRENKPHRNPVDVYREISRIINEKKWKRRT
jgi:hypothetical protein